MCVNQQHITNAIDQVQTYKTKLYIFENFTATF